MQGAPISQTEVSAAKPEGYLQDIAFFHWSQFSPWLAFVQILAVAIALACGLISGHPAAGMIAASGAMTVGFGVLHRIRKSSMNAMLVAALGISLSNLAGMVAGHSGIGVVVFAAVWGFGYGLLTDLGGGTSWVGLQCAIVLLVSSAFPFTFLQALQRAGLMLAGGLLQALLVGSLQRVVPAPAPKQSNQSDHDLTFATMPRRMLSVCRSRWRESPICFYAIRMGIILAVAAEIYRRIHLASGYWIPMTALLVLKQDFRQTASRSLARVGGTMVGALCATLLAVFLHPSPVMLAVLVVFFVWWCYSTLNVNYALFTMFLTSYIVFLLALNNIPEAALIHRRTLCTLAGGGLAVLGHIDLLLRKNLFSRSLE